MLSGARTFDPERLGWVLQRTLGRLQPGDFQHLWSWRRGTVWLAHRAARRSATVVVPMSVLSPAYLDELLTGLRAHGHEIHHVLLDAPASVLHARIAADNEDPSDAAWRRQHVDIYEEARTELAARGVTVETGQRTALEVAVLVAAGLKASR